MIDRETKNTIIRERIMDHAPVEALAEKYNVSKSSVSRWTNSYLEGHNAIDAEAIVVDLEKENTRLRRENQELLAQNKVLRELMLEVMKGNLANLKL